jgi:tetratricopeptide (TPR) repeat protein
VSDREKGADERALEESRWQIRQLDMAVNPAVGAEVPRHSRPGLMRTIGPSVGFLWANLSRIALACGFVLVVAGLVVYGVSPTSVLGKIVADYREAQDRTRLVDQHIELGNDFFEIDELQAAGVEFQAALALEPTHPDAQRGLFKVELFESIMGNEYVPAIAEKRLKFWLDEDPDDPAAHAFLADVYLVNGDFARANAEYDLALAQNPRLAHAYLGKGNLFDYQGNAQRALELYRRAVEQAPSSQAALNNVGYMLFRLGRYGEALTSYGRLVQSYPRYMLPYYAAANAFRILGDLQTAHLYQLELVELLESASARDLPRNKQFWFFHTTEPGAAGGPIITPLPDYATKTFYARVSLALTDSLRGDDRSARRQLAQARQLPLRPDELAALRRLVLFDAGVLAAKRKDLAAPINRFIQAAFGPSV